MFPGIHAVLGSGYQYALFNQEWNRADLGGPGQEFKSFPGRATPPRSRHAMRVPFVTVVIDLQNDVIQRNIGSSAVTHASYYIADVHKYLASGAADRWFEPVILSPCSQSHGFH